jgi:hypothetical protein
MLAEPHWIDWAPRMTDLVFEKNFFKKFQIVDKYIKLKPSTQNSVNAIRTNDGHE